MTQARAVYSKFQDHSNHGNFRARGELANERSISDQPPTRIVPAWADEDRYVASDSPFYRIKRAQGQNAQRGDSHAPYY